MNRVAVTGIGAITPVGNSAGELWESLKSGKCGVDFITKFDTSDLKVKIAAEVKDFEPESSICLPFMRLRPQRRLLRTAE